MKIKIMLSVGLLVLTFSPGLQAMGGARDFARKLFLSKAGAAAGLLGIGAGGFIHAQNVQGHNNFLKRSLDCPLLPEVEKEIKEIFAKEGIEINIKYFDEKDCSPAQVFSCEEGKFLLLSKTSVDGLNGITPKDQPLYLIKDEVLAICEHERSHLKYRDLECEQLLRIISWPSIILTIKSARLCGQGRLVSGIMGLTFLGSYPLLLAALVRYQEKRADLSIQTLKAAQNQLNAFERYRPYEGSRDLLSDHPSFSERIQYTEKHICFLQQKERAMQENKK